MLPRSTRLCAFTLVALAAVPAFALDLKSLKPQGYVSDFAGVVDAENKAAVETYCAAVEKSTGAQLSFVTLKTLDGDPLEDVSIDLFRQFGVGQKGKDNGVQLLLVIDDHHSRLEVGHGLEATLPDGLDGQILLDMRPELQAGQYGEALLAAAHRIGQTIAQAQGVPIAGQPVTPLPSHEESHDGGIPWPLIVFGIIILLLILARGSRGGRGGRGGGGFLPGFILGNMLGGGFGQSGGGGGGGFGGFDSGGGSSGGFGGFGGGDAGGGGASSGW